MRSDMAKVIVERPRFGSSRKARKHAKGRLGGRCDEALPRVEGIKRMWRGGTKFLNEHLGPLRRYLDSQVGRPWNKVFSEICANIQLNSAVQSHVRDHVEQYVARRVDLVDGVPWQRPGDPYGGARRLRSGEWFVHPRTGILLRTPLEPRRPR